MALVGPLPRVKPWQLWRFFRPKNTASLSLSLLFNISPTGPLPSFFPSSLSRHCKSGDNPSSSSPFMELLPPNLDSLNPRETRADSLVSEFVKDQSTEFSRPIESSSRALTLLTSFAYFQLSLFFFMCCVVPIRFCLCDVSYLQFHAMSPLLHCFSLFSC